MDTVYYGIATMYKMLGSFLLMVIVVVIGSQLYETSASTQHVAGTKVRTSVQSINYKEPQIELVHPAEGEPILLVPSKDQKYATTRVMIKSDTPLSVVPISFRYLPYNHTLINVTVENNTYYYTYSFVFDENTYLQMLRRNVIMIQTYQGSHYSPVLLCQEIVESNNLTKIENEVKSLPPIYELHPINVTPYITEGSYVLTYEPTAEIEHLYSNRYVILSSKDFTKIVGEVFPDYSMYSFENVNDDPTGKFTIIIFNITPTSDANITVQSSVYANFTKGKFKVQIKDYVAQFDLSDYNDVNILIYSTGSYVVGEVVNRCGDVVEMLFNQTIDTTHIPTSSRMYLNGVEGAFIYFGKNLDCNEIFNIKLNLLKSYESFVKNETTKEGITPPDRYLIYDPRGFTDPNRPYVIFPFITNFYFTDFDHYNKHYFRSSFYVDMAPIESRYYLGYIDTWQQNECCDYNLTLIVDKVSTQYKNSLEGEVRVYEPHYTLDILPTWLYYVHDNTNGYYPLTGQDYLITMNPSGVYVNNNYFAPKPQEYYKPVRIYIVGRENFKYGVVIQQ